MMKEQKGITLVALVITIIVLLILAGVSIAALGGQNGILTNADKSKLASMEADAKEKIDIALTSIKTEIEAQRANDSTYTATNVTKANALNDAKITGIKATDTGYTVRVTTETVGSDTVARQIQIEYTTPSYTDLSAKVGQNNTIIYGYIDLDDGAITSSKVATSATY